jgi:hypothetical protein
MREDYEVGDVAVRVQMLVDEGLDVPFSSPGYGVE